MCLYLCLQYGMRALNWAAWFGHEDAIRLLVNGGANIFTANKVRQANLFISTTPKLRQLVRESDHFVQTDINTVSAAGKTTCNKVLHNDNDTNNRTTTTATATIIEREGGA